MSGDSTHVAGNDEQGPARKAPRDIEQRTFAFAVRTLKVVQALPQDEAGWAVRRQLARCGTSVGANVEEAQGALTRRDFAHRMNVARSEARETLYWLRLARELEMIPGSRLEPLLAEADELVRILTAIVKNTRNRE